MIAIVEDPDKNPVINLAILFVVVTER